MNDLRTLDENGKAFKLLDRSQYDGYLQARMVLNSGGVSSKEKPGVA
ncbi:MAG TPA: hypothetical protein VF630_18945 [Hymenobacter sp.]